MIDWQKKNTLTAHNYALSDFTSENPLVKRLVLHYLTYKHVFSHKEVIDYLKQNLDIFLWENLYKREFFRLLHARWKHFPKHFKKSLVRKILKGRIPEGYKKSKKYRQKDLLSWLERHSFLKDAMTKEEYDTVTRKYPNIALKRGEEAEFPIMFEGFTLMEKKEIQPKKSLLEEKNPEKLADMLVAEMNILKNDPDTRTSREMDFSEWSLSRNSENLFKALGLAAEGKEDDKVELVHYFFKAIESNKNILATRYPELLSLIRRCSDKTIRWGKYEIIDCYENIIRYSKSSLAEEFDIWEKLFNIIKTNDNSDCQKKFLPCYLVTSLMQKLYSLLFYDFFLQKRKRDSGLSDLIKDAWLKLKGLQGHQKFEAIAMYGAHMSYISEVDFTWFKENIFPVLCAWTETSRVIWDFFLYFRIFSPRLIEQIRSQLLALSEKLSSLADKNTDRYVELICHTSLYQAKFITPEEFRLILKKDIVAKSIEKRTVVLHILRELRNNQGNKKTELWDKTIKPWIKEYWPQDQTRVNKGSNELWIECLLEIPNPQASDIDLIISLLLSPDPGVLSFFKYCKNDISDPKYLKIIRALIGNYEIDYYQAKELSEILDNVADKHHVEDNSDYSYLRNI